MLGEVELQYQRENWDQAKYDEYMGQIRRSIEKRFGPGQLIAPPARHPRREVRADRDFQRSARCEQRATRCVHFQNLVPETQRELRLAAL